MHRYVLAAQFAEAAEHEFRFAAVALKCREGGSSAAAH